MINLAKLKDAGAVNFRARYLAVHRRSKLTVRSLIDVGAGRGNSSPVCPRTSGRKAGHGSSAPALNTLLLKRESIQCMMGEPLRPRLRGDDDLCQRVMKSSIMCNCASNKTTARAAKD